MGGETSKVRHSKSIGTKKSMANRCTQRTAPSKSKTSNSINCTDNSLLNVDFGSRMTNSPRPSIASSIHRSRSASIASSRSTSRQKHPIPIRDRNLIQSCFQNPHEMIGRKILQRVYEKRNGFANFYAKLSNVEKDEIEDGIKVLLKKTVANINFIDEVQRLAEEFGGKHVKFRAYGFKPEFFGVYADATITECIFLDNAMHPTHQTLTAFSSFITMVYSSVRDGFYGEMRRIRRTSNSFSTGSNSSFMRETVSSDLIADLAQRSTSPGNESGGSDFSAVIVIPPDNDNTVKPSNDL